MKDNNSYFKNLSKKIKIIFYVGIALFIGGIMGLEIFNPSNFPNASKTFYILFNISSVVGFLIAMGVSLFAYFKNKQYSQSSEDDETTISSENNDIKIESNNTKTSEKENCNDDACSSHNSAYNDVCNYCGSVLDKNQSVCTQCGHAQEIKCKKCGYMNKSSSTYCTNCDSKLD